MNQITQPANDGYGFGLDFNYALWTADTHITLTNVPWDNDYRNVVSFTDTSELNDYIDSRETSNTTITNGTYARANEPIRIQIPFSAAIRYNYVRVQNPAQPVIGDAPTTFFYFILGARHIAPSTTEITVQLDVWQTYSRFVSWGRCYVDRGHIGIANSENFKNFGRDFLTVPEGLDVGNEYNIYNTKRELVANNYDSYNGDGHWILVCSIVDLEADPGNVDDPNLVSSKGGVFFGVSGGASYYVFNTKSDFNKFMSDYSEIPWVTQGIISITAIPDLTRYGASKLSGKKFFGGYKAPGGVYTGVSYPMWINWRDTRNHIPPRYRNLNKFLTYPYTVIEATTLQGETVIMKPEMWNDNNARINEYINPVPPNTRVSFIPAHYNSPNITNSTGRRKMWYQYPSNQRELPDPVEAIVDTDNSGEYTAMSVSLRNFPKMAIVNDLAINYMASTVNSVSAAKESAEWGRDIAIKAAGVERGNVGKAIEADTAQTESAIRAANEQTNIQNSALGSSNLVNNIMGGFTDPVSMIRNNLQQGITTSTASAINSSSNSASRRASGISGRASEYTADRNKELANMAARGNYEADIAQINAGVQDAKMIQPSTSGQIGSEMFNFVTDNFGVFLKFKSIGQNAINVIGEYWLRYGYAVRRFITPPGDLKVMTKFSYWKFTETYIKSAPIPEGFKQALRGIMEKGVTVWSNADDIGIIDTADNEPLPGIYIDGYTPPPWEPEEPEPPVDPPTIKRKKKKMIVYATNDNNPGLIYALAGTSPGTDANWITTRSQVRADEFMVACGVDAPVNLSPTEFTEYENYYLAPVSTLEATPVQ